LQRLLASAAAQLEALVAAQARGVEEARAWVRERNALAANAAAVNAARAELAGRLELAEREVARLRVGGRGGVVQRVGGGGCACGGAAALGRANKNRSERSLQKWNLPTPPPQQIAQTSQRAS
jgi:hypothetical protein